MTCDVLRARYGQNSLPGPFSLAHRVRTCEGEMDALLSQEIILGDLGGLSSVVAS